jgi:hypothetical protein
MEQLDIIAISFFSVGILSVAFGIWAVIAFYKPIKKVDAELFDDTPARYEEFEECFYNP